jgi:hypothetical protein
LNGKAKGEKVSPVPEPYDMEISHSPPPPVAPSLEHRASMKRFVSPQFLNPKTVCRASCTGISPSQGCYLHGTAQTAADSKMPASGFDVIIATTIGRDDILPSGILVLR